MDKPRHECGVIGIYNSNNFNLAHEIYLGLYALQHRGQLSCGIAINHGKERVDYIKDFGLVPEVFAKENMKKLSRGGNGITAIGHVRYSPGEFSEQANSQPLVMRYARGCISISNNGRLTNFSSLQRELEDMGTIFQTGSDAELIGYMIARQRLKTECIEDAIADIMPRLEGAYSFVVLSPKKLLAVRDPNGFRPLCIGKLKDSYVVASESCAIQSIGATFIRDVEPGEVVVIDKNGIRSNKNNCGNNSSLCVFEYIYFARSDSVIDSLSVNRCRREAGAVLAHEFPVEADVVIGVPDSGLDAAIGYSKESGIPYEIGFIKNRYIGRTFIQNKQNAREKSVQIKLNPIRSAIKGKRIVLIDDSIVRGTTSVNIVNLLKLAGATQIHMRISSPPFLNPCYFGTDISSREYLIACRLSNEEICKKIGADSLGYLSMNGLRKITKSSNLGLCDACFTGKYPINISDTFFNDKFNSKLKFISK
ncbi:MAG TPA: amidophosphoribosyltransferase [Clostridia bacterium]|nr:amidophosphoribosyltransferase [Clostridia bacterium]